ncbi:MAG: hypothetical protein MUO67_21745 [Anaerolineales bacterium]|nr:hypothetical protein [Anaerolineales bacterium]
MSSTPLMFKILNPFMKTILKSPVHKVVSDGILIITFMGIKSGKEYSTPISYFMENGTVYCFTHAQWWRNLAEGAEVKVRLQGQDTAGFAQVEAEDMAQKTSAMRKMVIAKPQEAGFYNVTFDSDGEPVQEEVIKAAEEAVLIRISY